MRTKQLVSGLNNNQKIRVICEGVAFVTTVKGAFDMGFHHQRVAVSTALCALGCDQYLPEGKRSTGYASRIRCYKADGEMAEVDVQVDLL
jgi:hypothetical protein